MLWMSLAQAGTGPWITSPGESQIYLGVDAQRFGRLAVSTGSFSDDVIDVDNGVSAFTFKAIASVGIVRRLELEAELPYGLVFTSDAGDTVCASLGLGACQRTQGLGIAVMRLKALALDELYGPPISLAFTMEARFGQFTAKDRERITNLGEGTFDLAPRVAIGRIGSLGQEGSWSVGLDIGWRYRFPLRNDHAGATLAVPGWELDTQFETMFSPMTAFAIGPAVSWLYRPNGVNFEDVDLDDVDRLGALRISALNLGLKVFVRGSDRVSLSLSGFHTLHAINNPSNVFTFSAGVSIRDPFKRRSNPEL